jgi:hypothetical protein
MKIVDFVPALSTFRKGQCSINISAKGLVALSGEACRIIGIQSGDEIVISYDKDSPKNWYIRKGETQGERKLILRKPKSNTSKSQCLSTNCVDITVQIFKSLNIDKPSVSMVISREPENIEGVNYFPIITRSVTK